ncbi:hypothetical protein [Phycicoccus flavus]|uniref:Uncharacterized protein n=1 Tax=Phycicoccus flavus TaxID=2502783 RepID=A0A8T6R0S7_9MICO|nr:hypothetical protein [Phycicoccus flavus]NHA67243.1 hypothetical protein [Phycicoccus flavus]
MSGTDVAERPAAPPTDDAPRRERRVLLAAVGLVAAGVALRAWVGYAGWFSLDDYVFYTRAASMSPGDPDLLFTPYNGHLMPGAMLWVWLATALDPLGHGLVVTSMLAVLALTGVAVVALFRSLFGRSEAVLLPVAVYALSTLSLPGSTWWAAALNQLPQVLFTALALLAQVRCVRTGHHRWGLASAAAVAAGLAFSEKTALAMPLVAAVTWLFLTDGPPLRALVTALRRSWVTWAAYLVLGAAYVAVYVSRVPDQVGEGASLGQVVGGVGLALRRTVLPGLLGGPWRWQPLGVADSLADPTGLMELVAAVAVGLVVVLSLRVGARPVRAWGLAVVVVVVDVALVVLTRVPRVGADPVLLEYRYFTDLSLVLALCVGLAFLPVRGRTPPAHRDRGPTVLGVWTLTPDVLRTVAGTAVVLLGLGALVSASGFRDRWAANPGRAYFAAAVPSARDIPETARVYDGPVPDRVIWRLLWPATLPSRLLPPTGATVTPLTTGGSTADLRDFAADGRLRRSEVSGISLAVDGGRVCPDGPRPVRVEAVSTAFSWAWVVQLDLSADRDGTLTLGTPNGGRVEVPVAADQSRVWVMVEDEIRWVDLSASPGSGLCVTGGVVGLPQPVTW